MSNPAPLNATPPAIAVTATLSPPALLSTAESTSTGTLSQALSNLGLGYGIAIAFGFLVLLSSLLLSSYLCFRRLRHHPPTVATPPPTVTSDGGIILPRIIFVAEDDDEGENTNRNGNSSSLGVVGLNQAVINSYKKFQFVKSDAKDSSSCTCSICLCDYREGEMVRMMPDCKHFFHLLCLDAWLRLNGSCPVCRNSPLPTPLSTPLAEVVPLAQYPDNRRRRS